MEAARALIAYGANPNADLSKLTVTEGAGGGMTMQGPGAGSVLIYAARSGNPELVREILRYGPKLELRDREGKTAMLRQGNIKTAIRMVHAWNACACLPRRVRDVNARDHDGNTPLHETFLTDVEEELLKLGGKRECA